MRSLQILVPFLMVLLVGQKVAGVVNSGHSAKVDETPKTADASSDKPVTNIEDSVATATEEKENRRIASGEAYRPPAAVDTYLPPEPPSNPTLPVPVYGVPDAPSNNVVYPAPPPDIPPPLEQPSHSFELPNSYVPQTFALPPITKYGAPIKPNIKPTYGPPWLQYGPPGKPLHGSKLSFKYPQKSFGGVKKPFGTHFQDTYTPKFVPQANSFNYQGYSNYADINHQQVYRGSSGGISNGHFTTQYDAVDSIRGQYGPPQPSPHPKPPHPGVAAPPTPPDIKYDGWKPIPGLVSRAPIASYGLPSQEQHIISDVSYNKDLIPPPPDNHIEHHQSSSNFGSIANLALEQSHGTPQQISDSYGAPLNTVTGSGGIVGSSGDEVHGKHHLQLENSHLEQDQSYGAPTAQSFSNFNKFNSNYNSHKFHANKGGSFSGSGIGLIPPSGVYGIPPSGQYGTPLYSSLNALKINSPKHPVIHREPVPPSIFDSILKNSHKHEFSNLGQTYSPPPILDIPKPSGDYRPSIPSNLYSLPNTHFSSGFQNLHQSSYNAPLNIVDGSYNLPKSHEGEIVGLDFSHPGLTIDFTQQSGQAQITHQNSQNIIPDCLKSANYAQNGPLPVPAAQTGYEVTEPKPQETYGNPDLDIAHSQKNSVVKVNAIEAESEGKAYGKTVAADIDPNSELIQSQSINLSNIPLQGSMGSYTLQIQSADGHAQSGHNQVLNDALLQSILAAIEQPERGGTVGQPIIQLQKSLEQQNFVTNDTISSVVGQLTDDEIRYSTQLAKDAIDKTSEVSDSDVSSSMQYIVQSPEQSTSKQSNEEAQREDSDEGITVPYLEDNGIALYFSNNHRSKEGSDKEEGSADNDKATTVINE